MHKLFTAQGSVGSAAVEAALHLTRVEVEFNDAPPWDGGPALQQLGQLNPLAQVPTLVLPSGRVLTESAAILIHLGLTHPAARLLPADAEARAQNIRGLIFIAANCYPDISVLDFPDRYCADCTEDDRKRIQSKTRAHLHQLWSAFAKSFDGAPFLNGDCVGALDLLAASVSKCFGTRPYLQQHHPVLAALLTRVDRDDRFAKVHDKHWPPAPQ
ncbi:MAG: glutathione S-transferase family protein [Pseudomonadota bacterium]|nr:glutathione S-transferase family protein [Pseudomonadota bacterium]